MQNNRATATPTKTGSQKTTINTGHLITLITIAAFTFVHLHSVVGCSNDQTKDEVKEEVSKVDASIVRDSIKETPPELQPREKTAKEKPWKNVPENEPKEEAKESKPTEIDPALLRAKWKLLEAGPKINGKQDDLYFLDPMVGWSINGLGKLYHTTDGGKTFQEIFTKRGTYFRSILFLDKNIGFLGNLGAGLTPAGTDPVPFYRTIDGGKTWEAVSFTGPTPKGICNMSRRGQQIYAVGRVGNPGHFMKSTDGGQTWESKDMTSQIPALIDVHFSSALEGILVGGSTPGGSTSQTIVLRTEDGGNTWKEVFRSKEANQLAWKISFPTPQIGYISVQGGPSASFLKTTDGGNTFSQISMSIGQPYSAKGIGFLNENVGWIAGERPGKPAYKTMDGGKTWTPDTSLGPLINRFRFVDGKVGYAIGQSIYKLEAQ